MQYFDRFLTVFVKNILFVISRTTVQSLVLPEFGFMGYHYISSCILKEFYFSFFSVTHHKSNFMENKMRKLKIFSTDVYDY